MSTLLPAPSTSVLLPASTVGRQSIMDYASPGTDISTDPEIDENNQAFEQGHPAATAAPDSSDKGKLGPKTIRRLAQNREAARRSRLRKKAYVQQLENSSLKLAQLEQELQRARQQGFLISTSGDQPHSANRNGALAFDTEYAQWLEEHNKQMDELRAAVAAHAGDGDLQAIVDSVMAHAGEIFRLRGVAARADAFHVLSGTWTCPVERWFIWLGGFRPSELLKLLASQLEPITEKQLASLCSLRQASRQAEDALSQEMEALRESVTETVAAGSSGNVADDYAGQMAAAVGKLGNLESLLRQADDLRLQALRQVQRVLTTRQSARSLLAVSGYFSRLRALSSLWIARPSTGMNESMN